MDHPTNSSVEDSDQGVVGYKPRIGLTFSSENEAYDFYNRYGGIVGFSIRRDYAHRSKEDKTIITQRRFVCNKEGSRTKDKRDINMSKPRAETRTSCLAKMGISRLANGKYECRYFVEEHNHELQTPATSHLMRSQRAISSVRAFEIDMVDDSGIRPKITFDYWGMQAGERENLGYTRQDLKNYLRTKRQRDLAYGEAGTLCMYFANRSRLNPSFTYSLQLDNNEQITNIFWADPRMIIDYTLFGDVVSFDTTFCTNKEYRPFGIFTGFNHHRGVIIFGAALLYDATAESFKWLFERFLEAHGQKKPITIFTDQNAAIARAISEVLTETRHALCTWHIMQHGAKHLGNLMKEGSNFLTDLKKCIFQYEEEVDFENAWKKLCDDYLDEKTSWLGQIYEIKEKWANCYMKNTVTLGMRSTQLSESINNDLKGYLRCSLDVVQFLKHFEQVVDDKRANELKAEFEARNKLPKNMGFKAPIVKQAGKVYTPYIFEQFLEEYNWMGACSLKSRNDNNVLCEYVVGIVDEEGMFEKGEFRVLYNPSKHLIECSCRKFETYGILCCHALKILDVLDVKNIPETYILRRWTRAARSMVMENSKGTQEKEDVQLDCTQRFRFLCPKFVGIATQASNSAEGFDLANKVADVLCKQLESLVIDGPSTKASLSMTPPSSQASTSTPGLSHVLASTPDLSQDLASTPGLSQASVTTPALYLHFQQ